MEGAAGVEPAVPMLPQPGPFARHSPHRGKDTGPGSVRKCRFGYLCIRHAAPCPPLFPRAAGCSAVFPACQKNFAPCPIAGDNWRGGRPWIRTAKAGEGAARQQTKLQKVSHAHISKKGGSHLMKTPALLLQRLPYRGFRPCGFRREALRHRPACTGSPGQSRSCCSGVRPCPAADPG